MARLEWSKGPCFPLCQPAILQPSLETLQTYARFLGWVRRALTPQQKHWYHASLQVSANGLTTTPIPAGQFTFDMTLDLIRHELAISTSRGDRWHRPLQGQSANQFCKEGLALLAYLGVEPDIDHSLFTDTTAGRYDASAVESYFQALTQIDTVFKQFKGELREETGPVQFWPHHMDLALLWYSGRLVPGVDPADEENADEQMNFGFSPGDGGISDPYIYATAYPTPNGLTDAPLPTGAVWHTDGFTGAVMMYASLVEADDPAGKLLTFLRTVQHAGAGLMGVSPLTSIHGFCV